ncbi:PX domain-containing protein kinase-like protein [Agrilus planipennis]|uniref:PX domain-containing protein kinase-like protein n=1 Tax=Agrilus planipennis TaxID=224129 RepID=A0A1W4WMQ9_AGRPL|nr:PX domain-containing protein kinase-like protein [Agrilus planipennis]
MAIFEQETAKKVLLDDTECLSCVIENWRNINGHIEYTIRVQRGPFRYNTWIVNKRYNDFVNLQSQLQISGIPLPLPPKKFIGNLNPEFVSERQKGLQKYLNTILMNPILMSSLPAKAFVDPANYCRPFGEIALQHVSLALRSEVGWEVIGPLDDIGWRIRKHYYQVRNKNTPKNEKLASWTEYGPDKYLSEKDMQAVFKSLSLMQHPFVQPIDLCLCTDVGGLVVRPFFKDGSLRDILYDSKPKQPFMKKYGNSKAHNHLDNAQIALYGRQILEAIKFLHDKGLPYGHLHASNILIDEGRAKLLDIENGILGVPSYYRPYFMQHRKIFSLQSIDVYCFGHTLYEMTFGVPLRDISLNELPGECSPELKKVLESILSAEACKTGLPTIENLLSMPFFQKVALVFNSEDKAQLKIPSSIKERLKNVQAQIEERLKDEQKMMRSQKRMSKVQEMMSSEEEKKKQRHKRRQEQKLQSQRSIQEKEKEKDDGMNGERSDSVNSASTVTSVGTITPPSMSDAPNVLSSPPPPAPPFSAPAPPPPPPPLLNGSSKPPDLSAVSKDRSALLGAICNFDKSALRKTSKKSSSVT